MFGIPVDGPANMYCDNNSVVINSSYTESTLKKKHNAIAYHKVWESIVQGVLRVAKEPGDSNLADILTKPLPGATMKCLIQYILYWSKFYHIQMIISLYGMMTVHHNISSWYISDVNIPVYR